jgi:hypothetical protein
VASNQNLKTTILFTSMLALFSLAGASSSRAQATPPSPETQLLAANDPDAGSAPVSEANEEATVADPSAQTSGSTTSQASTQDDQWHIAVSPYLWFPGMYGTVGFPNRNLHVHASAGEVLSHFRFGLLGAAEFRRKWLVTSLDVIYARLEDDKAVPLEPAVITGNVKTQELLLTGKIGLRLVDQKKLKVDFLTGFRYWHVANELNFNPSALGLSFSNSLNWVDPLVGGRIEAPLSPKIVANILGDVGGWGTGSLIEYQVVGALGYKIKPKWTLSAGYRYLRVDYRAGLFLMNLHEPGVLVGLTIDLK